MLKVLLVGIDGLEPKYIMKWKDLRYFHRIVSKGAFGNLMSTLPSYSVPAWLSFKTGKNPGRLGVYSFEKRENRSYRLIENFHYHCGEDFWDFLSDANFRVGIVNIPFTHPAKKINGIMITTADVDSPAAYYPPELRNKIYETFGKEKTWYRGFLKGISNKALLRDWKEIVLRQIKLYTDLLKEDFDFFACSFNVDILQHYIRDTETIHRAYLFLDSAVRKLVKIAKPDNLIIMSDHGGAVSQGTFHINTFLKSRAFLSLVEGAKPSSMGRVLKLLGRVQVVTTQIQRTPLLGLIKKFFSPISSFNKMIEKIDWSRTSAYNPSLTCIFLNLKGREPEGIVSESEYEEVCERIRQELCKVMDNRNGKKIDIRVYLKNRIYEGQQISEMPDIVIDIPHYVSSVLLADQLVTDPMPGTVCHSLFGAMMAVGKDVNEGIQLGDAKITSIAPTILHIYGLPIPDYMDRVLLELFRPGSDPDVQEPCVDNAQSRLRMDIGTEEAGLSREEEEIMAKRLRKLGYI